MTSLISVLIQFLLRHKLIGAFDGASSVPSRKRSATTSEYTSDLPRGKRHASLNAG
jgi:hypothetical protein